MIKLPPFIWTADPLPHGVTAGDDVAFGVSNEKVLISDFWAETHNNLFFPHCLTSST